MERDRKINDLPRKMERNQRTMTVTTIKDFGFSVESFPSRKLHEKNTKIKMWPFSCFSKGDHYEYSERERELGTKPNIEHRSIQSQNSRILAQNPPILILEKRESDTIILLF